LSYRENVADVAAFLRSLVESDRDADRAYLDDKGSDPDGINRSFDDAASFRERVGAAAALPSPRAATPVRAWAVAATLSLAPPTILARALAALMAETSLLVVASDSARAGAVALGLASLLAPLEWQGALIMTLPSDELDLLGSPVPFVAGCSTATAARANAEFSLNGDGSSLARLAVLYVDRQHEQQFSSAAECGPPHAGLVAALAANAASFPRGADPCALFELSADVAASVRAARSACAGAIEAILGDLASDDGWKTYGSENLETDDFEFVPDWFLAPRRRDLELVDQLAHTQMLLSYVDGRRERSRRGC
jgi:hypothetical protein